MSAALRRLRSVFWYTDDDFKEPVLLPRAKTSRRLDERNARTYDIIGKLFATIAGN